MFLVAGCGTLGRVRERVMMQQKSPTALAAEISDRDAGSCKRRVKRAPGVAAAAGHKVPMMMSAVPRPPRDRT